MRHVVPFSRYDKFYSDRPIHWNCNHLRDDDDELIAHFVMVHLVSGINSLHLFVNLIEFQRINISVPPFPTHLFLHPSLLPLLIHHTAHP